MEIQGYPNYLIYSDGRVESKKRQGSNGGFLIPTLGTQRYYYVGLCRDGKKTIKKIHRLVAEAYIPNPENKKCVDHINRIKSDNRLENLRWATHSENSQNTGIYSRNKSGHKYVCYYKRGGWQFQKEEKNKYKIQKHFKTKTQALCYKYIALLKINAKIF